MCPKNLPSCSGRKASTIFLAVAAPAPEYGRLLTNQTKQTHEILAMSREILAGQLFFVPIQGLLMPKPLLRHLLSFPVL